MVKPVEAICYPSPYSRVLWSCTQHLSEQLKLWHVAVASHRSLSICCFRCCLSLVLQLQSSRSLILSLWLSLSKWPWRYCWAGLGWAVPVSYSRASSGVSWTAVVLSSFGVHPGWLFPPSSLFSYSLFCVLFNLPLQDRECGWEGRECQGSLGSPKWQAYQLLHRLPSGLSQRLGSWHLLSTASTSVCWAFSLTPEHEVMLTPVIARWCSRMLNFQPAHTALVSLLWSLTVPVLDSDNYQS